MQLLLDDSVRLLQRLGKNLIIPSLRFPAALGERRSKDWTQKNQGVSGVFVYFSVEGISKGVRSLFLPKNSTQQIWPRLAQNMTSEEICFFFFCPLSQLTEGLIRLNVMLPHFIHHASKVSLNLFLLAV